MKRQESKHGGTAPGWRSWKRAIAAAVAARPRDEGNRCSQMFPMSDCYLKTVEHLEPPPTSIFAKTLQLLCSLASCPHLASRCQRLAGG